MPYADDYLDGVADPDFPMPSPADCTAELAGSSILDLWADLAIALEGEVEKSRDEERELAKEALARALTQLDALRTSLPVLGARMSRRVRSDTLDALEDEARWATSNRKAA